MADDDAVISFNAEMTWLDFEALVKSLDNQELRTYSQEEIQWLWSQAPESPNKREDDEGHKAFTFCAGGLRIRCHIVG